MLLGCSGCDPAVVTAAQTSVGEPSVFPLGVVFFKMGFLEVWIETFPFPCWTSAVGRSIHTALRKQNILLLCKSQLEALRLFWRFAWPIWDPSNGTLASGFCCCKSPKPATKTHPQPLAFSSLLENSQEFLWMNDLVLECNWESWLLFIAVWWKLIFSAYSPVFICKASGMQNAIRKVMVSFLMCSLVATLRTCPVLRNLSGPSWSHSFVLATASVWWMQLRFLKFPSCISTRWNFKHFIKLWITLSLNTSLYSCVRKVGQS